MILKKTIQYSKYTYIYLSIHLFFSNFKARKTSLFLTCLLMDYSIMSIIYSLKYWTRLPSVGQSVSPSCQSVSPSIGICNPFLNRPRVPGCFILSKKNFFCGGWSTPSLHTLCRRVR